ncbi:hypothetical protein VM1G_06835 [Cytospora mali]|uniref:Uncharacterized protein n=1 Tax=Cytospora mali TaxID=578113 RepID=A0A194W4K0_CYTMA|nr:hypothetical protein VM1G_06835 [Valsa mali]
MDRVILKQRVHSSPKSAAPLKNTISFRHPGYDDPEDILLTLPRLDSSPQSGAAAGVHYGTALLACQIIANNAFNGHLTTGRDGNNRVSIALDGILLDDDYWFVVDGEAGVYPVMPRFEDWQFPHHHMGSLTWDPKSQPVESQARLGSSESEKEDDWYERNVAAQQSDEEGRGRPSQTRAAT